MKLSAEALKAWSDAMMEYTWDSMIRAQAASAAVKPSMEDDPIGHFVEVHKQAVAAQYPNMGDTTMGMPGMDVTAKERQELVRQGKMIATLPSDVPLAVGAVEPDPYTMAGEKVRRERPPAKAWDGPRLKPVDPASIPMVGPLIGMPKTWHDPVED